MFMFISVPGSVTGLTEVPETKTSTTITVQWSRPNTDLTYYELNIIPKHDNTLTLPISVNK